MSVAVYIHVPFCLTKCGYCSFFSVPYSKTEMEKYFHTLKREISLYLENGYFIADTIYFGGGTPSLLPAEYLREIIGMFDRKLSAEITLEVNPIQITEDFLTNLKTTGVNRLSLGVQSMRDKNLQLLGRKHTAASIPGRVKLCRKHKFTNISVDFMYGLPGITLEEVEADLQDMLSLRPKHISTYLLSLEPDAPFAHWKDKLPTDDEAADQYEMICDTVREKGIVQYEISNFARHGTRSRHNLHYWLGDDYIGFGPGAHSSIHGHRFANHDNLQDWQDDIREGDISIINAPVDSAAQKAEFIIMQMRLIRGLDCSEYAYKFKTSIMDDYGDVIRKYIDMGYLVFKTRYLQFTKKALFVSNHILSEFV